MISQPFLCIFSIVNNTLVILAISNRCKAKLFKDKMYKYILVNAIFNICYSVTTLLRIVNTCLFVYASAMCSQVYQTEGSQYMKIIVAFFMGNVFMIGSNISYLTFAFYRLVNISEKKNYLFYTTFSRMNMKIYTLLVFGFAAAFSAFIFFQYNINVDNDYRKEFPYEKHDEFYCGIAGNNPKCNLLNGLKLANQIFNGILCVVLNLFIDICLSKVFNNEIKKKTRLDISKLKIDELKKKMEKLSKMIIANGVIYFLSHIPKFVTTLLLLIFANKLKKYCHERLSCDLINEEAEFFAIFSMIANFYIYKCFNSQFNESYCDLKAKFKNKLCPNSFKKN